MRRVVWLTDLHLNHCQDDYVEQFFGEVQEYEPHALLISGDFSESFQLLRYLRWLDSFFDCPIFFVLGNHDYYFSKIGYVRAKMKRLCAEHSQLVYLTQSGPVALTDNIGLVGHDGWADGRLGDYAGSIVMMHDYQLIDNLSGLRKKERWELLKQLGDAAAQHIREVLPPCLESFDSAFLLTHVPPVREACWHEGHVSDDQWAPHFTCKAVGDAILEIMSQHPEKQLTVLCGHTHGAGICQLLPNVEIHTGGAIYGRPGVAKVFEVE
jgi:Icc-related predicted phosphoesterase